MVVLRISSGFKFQFFEFPLTKPEMTTNSSTSTLMQVNILFTKADSFTPNARSPTGREKREMKFRFFLKFQKKKKKHLKTNPYL